MAVETDNAFSGPFIPNGATTTFPFTFTAPSAAEVAVMLRNADGTESYPTDFAVNLTPGGGGSVVFAVAPAAGPQLFILLDPFFTQSIQFENGSGWLAEPVNEVADRSASRDQVLRRDLLRGVRMPLGYDGGQLPAPADLIGRFLSMDVNGDWYGASGTGADGALRYDLSQSGGAAMVAFLQGLANSAVRSAESKLREVVSVLDFEDDDGNRVVGDGDADDTLAFQGLLDVWGGKAIHVPEGVTIKLNDTVEMSGADTKLFGPGKIITTAELAQKAVFKVTGDDCEFDGLTFDNVTSSQSQTGPAGFCIDFYAHRGMVRFCTFYRFQHGVVDSAFGEWYGTRVLFNSFLECLGAGDGPDDAVSTYGEDRCDAVTIWGAGAMVIGNFAQPANGQDCRIAFHTEALDEFAVDTSGPDNAAMTIIALNRAVPSEDESGRWRRLAVAENVSRVMLFGNEGRGFTWWGVTLAGSPSYSLMSHNIIVSDVDPADQSGAAWSPQRAGLMLFLGAAATQKANRVCNNVVIAKTASCSGFYADGANGLYRGIAVNDNSIVAEVDMGNYVGIGADDSPTGDITFRDNDVIGDWFHSLYTGAIGKVVVDGGQYDGADDFAINLLSASKVKVAGAPHILNSAKGIQVQSPVAEVIGLQFDGCAADEITFVSAGNPWVDQAYDRDGTGVMSIFGGGAIFHGRNAGFVTDSRVAATEITSIASRSNTWGKHAGKMLVDANNVTWVATGAAANSNWKKVEDGATATPA